MRRNGGPAGWDHIPTFSSLKITMDGFPNSIYMQRDGEIPEWLEGRLIQNGPGKFSFGNDVFNHLFDGSALLQQFSIKNGEATYMCRCVDQ